MVSVWPAGISIRMASWMVAEPRHRFPVCSRWPCVGSLLNHSDRRQPLALRTAPSITAVPLCPVAYGRVPCKSSAPGPRIPGPRFGCRSGPQIPGPLSCCNADVGGARLGNLVERWQTSTIHWPFEQVGEKVLHTQFFVAEFRIAARSSIPRFSCAMELKIVFIAFRLNSVPRKCACCAKVLA